jgi:hypothetical protein
MVDKKYAKLRKIAENERKLANVFSLLTEIRFHVEARRSGIRNSVHTKMIPVLSNSSSIDELLMKSFRYISHA